MERHFCKEVALAKKFGVQYKEACEGATSALRPVSDLVEAHLEHVRSIGCTFVDGVFQDHLILCQTQLTRQRPCSYPQPSKVSRIESGRCVNHAEQLSLMGLRC